MINLKPYSQKPGFCGPASLRMVMNFYGISATEKKLGDLSGTPPFEAPASTTIEGMIKAAKHFDFNVFYKENGSIEDLKYFISNNIPVIVRWFSGWWGHYSVVVDVDDKNVVMVDPETKKLFLYTRKNRIRSGKFMHAWFDFEGPIIEQPTDIIIRPMMVILPKNNEFMIKESLKMNLM